MSIFTKKDYKPKKNEKVYMRKTKLPTLNKSSTLRCGMCKKKGAKRLKFGRQTRILCPDCIKKANNRHEKNTVSFVKASSLYLEKDNA